MISPGPQKQKFRAPLFSRQEVSEKLASADLAAKGISLAGFYVDAQTCTIYVGLTEIKDNYTKPIKAKVNKVEGVKLEFFKARFTEAELSNLQDKIEMEFLGISSADIEKLNGEDEAIRNEMRKQLGGRTKNRLAETNIPLTLIAVDIKNNGLKVGLKEIKPQYVEAIRQVVGTEVPIEFIEGEVTLDSTKTSRHRPMLGGIQVTTPAGSSTLGFRATRHDGTVGFVMTGHAGWVGTEVWQPTRVSNNSVGIITVNPPGPRFSDAAFVPTANVVPAIWPGRSIIGWRSSFSTPPGTPPGTPVRMEGKTSCGTTGIVRSINVTVWCPIFGTLHRQVLATYARAGGDSGAPTFGVDGAGNAIIFGIHSGLAGSYAFYSPVEGVANDLALRWGSH
ncbi:MAG: hypothetical protein DDT21_00174 [Syntrophomonadaceae bacterium]|nr:hypothetical protein [Bacillota bacterium]